MSEEIKREEEIKETAVAEEVVEKPYTLRDLCDEDLYTVTEIIAKALPDEAKKVFAQKYAEEKAKAEKGKKEKVDMVELVGAMVGFDIIRFILSNINYVVVSCKQSLFIYMRVIRMLENLWINTAFISKRQHANARMPERATR